MATPISAARSLNPNRRPLVTVVPGLDLRLLRRFDAGEGVQVTWRTTSNIQVATAEVSIVPDEVRMRWDYNDNMWADAVLNWGAEAVSTGARPRTFWFTCPKCGKHASVMYLHLGVWACRKCHKLVYASQYMTPNDSLRQELAFLDEELARGRPRYGRYEAWQDKIARAAEMRKRLALEPARSSHRDINRNRVVATYVKMGGGER